MAGALVVKLGLLAKSHVQSQGLAGRSAMNYNHDTEMDMRWEADQARRFKLLDTGLPDASIRRVTAGFGEATMSPGSLRAIGAAPGRLAGGNVTLGNALSALAINAKDPVHLAKVCREILEIIADRDRIGMHREFVELKGAESMLEILRHHKGEVVLVALQILDKLSRTSAREISACGAIDVIVRICETDGQAPRTIETALRVLHGLTFENDVKLLLLRHGVRELAEALTEARPALGSVEALSTIPTEDDVRTADQAWHDVLSISTRLLTRLGGSRKGGLRRLPA
mmetsp:Transcript_24475/g.62544  ORF Transcript_24475/g.62544 Transcript_24475/m.62544 type:complete len:285 (-) Transcript_24475:85-939(-)